jgi:cytochrome P450
MNQERQTRSDDDHSGPAGCPVTSYARELPGYDPLSACELRDPYPSFAVARAEAPVFFSERFGMWSVTRQADLLDVLRDNEGFSNSRALPIYDPPAALRERMPEYPWARSILLQDDPKHRVARRVVQAPFTPRNVKTHALAIRDLANHLLDPWLERGTIDILNDYALPLSLGTIGHLIGVSENDFELMRRSIDSVFRLMSMAITDEDEILVHATVVADFVDYLSELAEDRRANPREDFTSVMVQTPDPDGSPQSTEQMVKHLFSLLTAGFDTTAQMMTHGIADALEHPEQWQALVADPSLIEGAVEEMLRHRTLVKRIFRVANRDVEVGGVTIPQDSLVSLLLASANHDEAVYDEPRRFDIWRQPEHLAFGRWKHFCPGAPLARLEMKITLETLTERLPDLRIAEGQAVSWKPDIRLDAVNEYRLEWDPRLGAVAAEGRPA